MNDDHDFFKHFDNVEFLVLDAVESQLSRYELSEAELKRRYATEDDAE